MNRVRRHQWRRYCTKRGDRKSREPRFADGELGLSTGRAALATARHGTNGGAGVP
jgi:hypothetical protein